MAATTDSDEEIITTINVTPLVDVVLVLLIVLMVTASYIVAKTIPMDLPKAATGEVQATTLAISVDREGKTYLDAELATAAQLRARIADTRARSTETRAVIAADGDTAHRYVVGVIDLLRQEGVDQFAINVQPADLKANAP
jgi:biopolymer transport protein ExbD